MCCSGNDYYSFGFGGTGKKSHAKQFDDYGEVLNADVEFYFILVIIHQLVQSFTNGDVIGCYLDLDDMTITFSKNGKMFPTAFRIPKDLQKEVFYPAVVLKNAEMSFNFGADDFKFPAKQYLPVSAAPADCVVDSHIGSPSFSNYVQKYFATVDHLQVADLARNRLFLPKMRQCALSSSRVANSPSRHISRSKSSKNTSESPPSGSLTIMLYSDSDNTFYQASNSIRL